MARSGINKREIDRWAKGVVKETNKSLERAQRRNPPRVSAQIDVTTGAVPGSGVTESNGYLARLLLWLDGREKDNPSGYINVAAFPEELRLEDEDPVILALQLDQHGLVELLRAMGVTARPHVRLTDAGRVAARQLKDLQKDRAARIRHTIDALLRWLFDAGSDQTPVNPALFLATPSSYFAGTEISGTDLQQALVYLAEHRLIDYIDTDPATAAITSQGTSCALAGGSVQDHINQPRPGTTYNTYLPNAKGVIIGEQQHFTQNNTDGVDPALFIQAAGYIGQVSTILGMPDEDRVELERVAQDLHDEATSDSPEPGRLRQFATQLKNKLLEGTSTMAATQGVQLIEQALAALTQ
ncbi:hypothetical protein ACIQM4_27815 [Streptomyces sp. NPDC091272]|uniref:hypothetical protein n=1 Tax=Streptomyces sp. NPDC091272 TaxID=3365981 RepID=UPI00382BD90B